MIKYNIKTVNDWLYNSNPIKGMYYNGRKVYRRFVANGQPTPPVFDGKFKAEYSDGTSYSAACDGTTSLTTTTTRAHSTSYTAMTDAVIGDCVKTLGTSVFSNCNSLTSVTIPNTVTSIGGSAFIRCSSLTSIDIPDSVTSIDNYAFYGCSSLPIENNIRYADTYAIETIDKTLSTYKLKDSTRFIGYMIFNSCTGLTSINIPDSVTSIGGDAFQSCTNLIKVNSEIDGVCNISDNVTSIGGQAFNGCKGITSFTIGSGVTSIGNNAFNVNNRNLSSITIQATTPPTIYQYTFNGSATNNCPIYVPSQSVEAYKSADVWNTYASRIQPIS